MSNPEDKVEIQKAMFGGLTSADLRAAVRGETTGELTARAESVLSDAQELMTIGNLELARQLINRAKFYMAEITEMVNPR